MKLWKFKEELCKGIDCKQKIDNESRNQVIYKVTPYGKLSDYLITFGCFKTPYHVAVKILKMPDFWIFMH